MPNLDVSKPVDGTALGAAVAFFHVLPELPRGSVHTLPLHWPAGGYCDHDASYNLSTVLEPDAWRMEITHPLEHNARRIPADAEANVDYAAHTLGRNSFALGCAIDGMAGATTADFGPDGIQEHELEAFCAMVGAAAAKYGVDVADRNSVFTHAEAAVWDGYAEDRWDLGRTSPSDAPLTDAERFATGNVIRARCRQYKLAVLEALK